MFCTNCGKEVADGAMFCTSCGAKIDQEPAAQPATEQPANAGVPESVTASIPDTPQTASGTAPVSASDTPKKSNTGIVIIAAAAVLIVALALLLFSGGGGGYKDYKELAQAYYEAIYNQDVNAMIKLFDKDAQKELKEDKDYIEEEMEEMKEDMNDWYGRGWQRKVESGTRERREDRGTYRLRITIDGEFHKYLYIKRDDKDRYYIHEDYSDF